MCERQNIPRRFIYFTSRIDLERKPLTELYPGRRRPLNVNGHGSKIQNIEAFAHLRPNEREMILHCFKNNDVIKLKVVSHNIQIYSYLMAS